MTREQMQNEIDEALGKANVKLFDICGDKSENYVVTCDTSGDDIVVVSGTKEILRTHVGDVLSTCKKVKRSIWSVVDAARDAEKPACLEQRRFSRISTFDNLMEKVDDVVRKANEKMSDIVRGGYPFTLDEVKISVDSDSAGIYIHSGRTPICAIARAGDPEMAFQEIKAEVWSAVDGTRNAVEVRSSVKAAADEMASESDKREKAAAALKAAGLDPSEVLGGVDEAAKEAVVEAAKEAVKRANRGTWMRYTRACEAIYGSIADSRFSVKGYSGGFVVSVGGHPVFITRFPKVANNASVEKMLKYIAADIAEISEDRRGYLAGVEADCEKEERLRELSHRLDDVTAQLVAASAS